jgi:hypothetical protein
MWAGASVRWVCLWFVYGGFGGVWRLVCNGRLHGLCRDMGWAVEGDRPLGKVGERMRLGVGWDEWEREGRELWCVGWK